MESMVNGGWVKLYRELKSKSIWQLSSPQQKVVLITILLLANHEENKWEWKGEEFACKPGQLITSLNSLVRECGEGITIRNVRTALERFEKLGFLTNTSTKNGRLITIVNWNKYQGKDSCSSKLSENSRQSKSVTKVLNPENSTKQVTMPPTKNGECENTVKSTDSEYTGVVNDKATDILADKEPTKSRQTADKEPTTNKKDKEYKKDKEEKNKPAALSSTDDEWLSADELAKREGIDLNGNL